MNVINPIINEDMLLFYSSIVFYKNIEKYWDWTSLTCDLNGLIKNFPALTASEKTMASFFISVWYNKKSEFDIVSSIKTLGYNDRGIIIDWVVNPYFPCAELTRN